MIMHCSVVTTLLGRFWHEPTIALCQPVPGCDSGHCTVQWLLPWCRWYGGFLWRGRDVSCDISFALKLRRRFPANVIYSMKRRLRFCLPSVWVLFFLAPSVFSEHLFLSFCPFFFWSKVSRRVSHSKEVTGTKLCFVLLPNVLPQARGCFHAPSHCLSVAPPWKVIVSFLFIYLFLKGGVGELNVSYLMPAPF